MPDRDTQSGATELAVAGPTTARLEALARGTSLIAVDDLVAGYGDMEVLHGVSLRLGAGQSLCLVGPNGAGKSTVLQAIYGFARVLSGRIVIDGHDVTRLTSNEMLATVGLAYVLQDNSVFPDMTVEENLLMGGYLLGSRHRAQGAAERAFDKYPRLAARRTQRASALSGGERRLLEIARSLVMDPRILLIDEPSIGLEPRYIDIVFDTLTDLQRTEGRTIVLVEQNAKKGLEFADIGYVLTAGRIAVAGTGKELARDPAVGRLFLGGD